MGGHTSLIAFILASVLLFCNNNNHVEGKTFTITIHGNTNLWSNKALWGGTFPGASDDVVIKKSGAWTLMILDKSGVKVKSLSIDGSTGTIPPRSKRSALNDVDVDPTDNVCNFYFEFNYDLTVTGAFTVSNHVVVHLDGFTLTANSVSFDASSGLQGAGTVTSPKSTISGFMWSDSLITFNGPLELTQGVNITIIQLANDVGHIKVQGSLTAKYTYYIKYRFPDDYTTGLSQSVLQVRDKATSVGTFILVTRTYNHTYGAPDICLSDKSGGSYFPSGCATTAGAPQSGYSVLLKSCASAAPCQCQHGGACIDSTGTKCSCPNPLWVGDLCNQPKCTDNCNGHGTCTVPTQSGDPYCSCTTGWSGPSCQTGTCKNNCNGPDHGSCVTSSTTPQCACTSGWAGDDCSVQAKTCANNCAPHGTCNSATGLCVCNTGYSGNACSVQS